MVSLVFWVGLCMALFTSGLLDEETQNRNPVLFASVPEACGPTGVCDCCGIINFVGCSDQGLQDVPRNIPTSTAHLYLQRNEISYLPRDAFKDLVKLEKLYLDENKISSLPRDVFKDLVKLESIYLSHNNLTVIPEDVFINQRVLVSIELQNNNLETFTDIILHLNGDFYLELSSNKLVNFSLRIDSLGHVAKMDSLILSGNDLSVITPYMFRGFCIESLLDISNNRISDIQPGAFIKEQQPHGLKILFIFQNKLTVIRTDTFTGLDQLRLLMLFNNKIHTIESEAFSGSNLRTIFLFGNKLTEISNRPFTSQSIETVIIFGNKIRSISDDTLVAMANNTSVYATCKSLQSLPNTFNHQNISCVSSTFVPVLLLDYWAPFASHIRYILSSGGFKCYTKPAHPVIITLCEPCGPGTYGNTTAYATNCHKCPKGGFYQDELSQTAPNEYGIPCKRCNIGTYVTSEGGTSLKLCEICPEGTNRSIHAGFRACFCKAGYSRFDRYGPCSICIADGLDCSHDFQNILPGYMWNWSFPTANITKYQKYVENLKIEGLFIGNFTNYTDEMPVIFKCPRSQSCANDNGSIAGNCEKGFTGWLCTNCEPDYIYVLGTCTPCPGMVILILIILGFVVLCVFVCLLFSWRINQDTESRETRPLVAIIISRVKILLGFYQVTVGITESMADIKSTGFLLILGTILASLEGNILRLFGRSKCFDGKFDLSPQRQFIFALVLPVAVATPPMIVYVAARLYVCVRYSTYRARTTSTQQTSRLITCVVAWWFIIYTPVCSIIFSFYQVACKTFPLDKQNRYNMTRLLSDYDVDCKDIGSYHLVAYVFTVLYVIAFPGVLFFILWVPSSRIYRYFKPSPNDDGEHSPPVCLYFLWENYKDGFGFWEIIELARKVSQTFLITLFGWRDRLTILLTTCISVAFLVLHARCTPMKYSRDQGLQMFSLTVIFINVVIATNFNQDEYTKYTSVIVGVLNISILLVIIGELLVMFLVHIKRSISLSLRGYYTLIPIE